MGTVVNTENKRRTGEKAANEETQSGSTRAERTESKREDTERGEGRGETNRVAETEKLRGDITKEIGETANQDGG